MSGQGDGQYGNQSWGQGMDQGGNYGGGYQSGGSGGGGGGGGRGFNDNMNYGNYDYNPTEISSSSPSASRYSGDNYTSRKRPFDQQSGRYGNKKMQRRSDYNSSGTLTCLN